jgi:tRNA threonylcarbamoyl adenosine modification protein YeaZ
VLVLAFDTATDAATSALVHYGEVVGERVSRAVRILEDVDSLLAEAALQREEIEGIVVGTGPGSYTGLRMGLVTARALSIALGAPVAGVSTLAALAAGVPGAHPVIDAKRSEVFALKEGSPAVMLAENLPVRPGDVYVGDGAVRYRDLLEARGARVPPDDAPVHTPWARHHASLARGFGSPDAAQPIYLRLPDAERSLAG